MTAVDSTVEADVLVEEHGNVLVVTINRPQQKNAMTLSASRVIAEAMDTLDRRVDLTVGVITGNGGTFCAGMDLKRFAAGERPYIEGRGFAGLVEAPPKKPLIAAVDGWALGGGCEVVLACDLVVAAADAKFGLPEVTRGLVARGGGVLRLSSRIPRAISLELVLTGDTINASRAEHFGLVNKVVEGQALPAALALAERIARNAPLAVECSKAVVTQSTDWSTNEMWQRQAVLTDVVFASEDAKEGAVAFTERRDPIWRGR